MNGNMGMNNNMGHNQNMMGSMNQALHVMQPSMNNMPPSDDCGCDGGSTNVDVLSRNLVVINKLYNQQQINNNAARHMIAP